MPAPGTRARRDLPAPARGALDAAGWTAGALFNALSRARRSKSLHPKGVAHAATVTIHGSPAAPAAGTLLHTPAEHEAIVRFSRGVGLPDTWPDVLGLALRLLDVHGPGRHQDFLLATSVDAPVLHHVLVPAGTRDQRPYSSSLPYSAGGERFLVGALPRSAERFDLCVARVLGRFEPVGEIAVGARLPDDPELRFSPWNTGGGIEPSGVFNRLRDYAYPLSQRGWSQ